MLGYIVLTKTGIVLRRQDKSCMKKEAAVFKRPLSWDKRNKHGTNGPFSLINLLITTNPDPPLHRLPSGILQYWRPSHNPHSHRHWCRT